MEVKRAHELLREHYKNKLSHFMLEANVYFKNKIKLERNLHELTIAKANRRISRMMLDLTLARKENEKLKNIFLDGREKLTKADQREERGEPTAKPETPTTTKDDKKAKKKKKNKMKTSKLATWSRIILPRNVRNGRSDISRKRVNDKKNLSTLSFHTFPNKKTLLFSTKSASIVSL
ncbi:unnamed protein product [Bathycoccus prasinos]